MHLPWSISFTVLSIIEAEGFAIGAKRVSGGVWQV